LAGSSRHVLSVFRRRHARDPRLAPPTVDRSNRVGCWWPPRSSAMLPVARYKPHSPFYLGGAQRFLLGWARQSIVTTPQRRHAPVRLQSGRCSALVGFLADDTAAIGVWLARRARTRPRSRLYGVDGCFRWCRRALCDAGRRRLPAPDSLKRGPYPSGGAGPRTCATNRPTLARSNFEARPCHCHDDLASAVNRRAFLQRCVRSQCSALDHKLWPSSTSLGRDTTPKAVGALCETAPQATDRP